MASLSTNYVYQCRSTCQLPKFYADSCHSNRKYLGLRFNAASGFGTASSLWRGQEKGLWQRTTHSPSPCCSPLRKGASTFSGRGPEEATSQWRSLLPQPLTYTSNFEAADAAQLSELWGKTLREPLREPRKIQKALRHSFALVIVKDESSLSSDGRPGRIVGVGRAVSDGAFVATICDVAVDPEYQRRGIGRKLVKRLIQDMKGRGPTGFAVFPLPMARRFFWMLGFRADRKYRVMAYKGKYLQNLANEGMDVKMDSNSISVSEIYSEDSILEEKSTRQCVLLSVSDQEMTSAENEPSVV